MNEPDLDDLRQRWQSMHTAIEPTLELDLEALRAGVAKVTRRAFSRHAFWLTGHLMVQIGVLVALGAFLLEQWHDPLYRVFTLAPALLALAQIVVSARRYLVLRTLDFTAATSVVRATIDRLRNEQLRVTRWILLTSVLLWLPILLVIVRGVSGFDLLTVLHPGVLATNLVVGVVFLLLGDIVLRQIAARFKGARWLHALLVEAAGYSWQRAENAFETHAELDDSIAAHGAQQTIDGLQAAATRARRLQAPLRALRTRLLGAALAYALVLLVLGAFNATHGGQPTALVPGVLLNFFFVAQMASAFQHRAELARLHVGASAPVLDAQLRQMAATHLTIVRTSLVFSPLALSMLLVLIAQLLLDIDVFTSMPVAASVLLIASSMFACALLTRRSVQPLLVGTAALLMFGVPGLSDRLVTQMHDRQVPPNGS